MNLHNLQLVSLVASFLRFFGEVANFGITSLRPHLEKLKLNVSQQRCYITFFSWNPVLKASNYAAQDSLMGRVGCRWCTFPQRVIPFSNQISMRSPVGAPVKKNSLNRALYSLFGFTFKSFPTKNFENPLNAIRLHRNCGKSSPLQTIAYEARSLLTSEVESWR